MPSSTCTKRHNFAAPERYSDRISIGERFFETLERLAITEEINTSRG